jgi:hypothetical protein
MKSSHFHWELAYCCKAERSLVYRLLNPLSFVAFKMGRRQGGPSRTGGKGAHI